MLVSDDDVKNDFFLCKIVDGDFVVVSFWQLHHLRKYEQLLRGSVNIEIDDPLITLQDLMNRDLFNFVESKLVLNNFHTRIISLQDEEVCIVQRIEISGDDLTNWGKFLVCMIRICFFVSMVLLFPTVQHILMEQVDDGFLVIVDGILGRLTPDMHRDEWLIINLIRLVFQNSLIFAFSLEDILVFVGIAEVQIHDTQKVFLVLLAKDVEVIVLGYVGEENSLWVVWHL